MPPKSSTRKGPLNLSYFADLANLTNTERQYLYHNLYTHAKHPLPEEKVELLCQLIRKDCTRMIKLLKRSSSDKE